MLKNLLQLSLTFYEVICLEKSQLMGDHEWPGSITYSLTEAGLSRFTEEGLEGCNGTGCLLMVFLLGKPTNFSAESSTQLDQKAGLKVTKSPQS